MTVDLDVPAAPREACEQASPDGPDLDLTHEMREDPRYPRTRKYDPEWLAGLDMGCPTFRLMESLSNEMRLEPGMRVLDLGCQGVFAGSPRAVNPLRPTPAVICGGKQGHGNRGGRSELDQDPSHVEVHVVAYAVCVSYRHVD